MHQNKFKIVIPSYNNGDWCEYNIASILNQTYTNYDVLYIDDKSTDKTYSVVQGLVGALPNWKVISNETNMKRGYNTNPLNPHIREFIKDDNDILVFVDGDDWLYDEHVLEKLNDYYNKNNPWMTYGAFVIYYGDDREIEYPSTQNTHYSNEIHNKKLYRYDYWRASHLRTFRWWLYASIKDDDLKFTKSGLYYENAEDLATSYPCLEMCGKNKIGVVDFLTYVYNQAGEVGARSIERQNNVQECDTEVRNRKVYDTITQKGTITSKLYGGLGNMLFQVAAGYSLAKKNNLDYFLYPEHSATLHVHPKSYLNSIFAKLQTINSVDGYEIVKERSFEYNPLHIGVDGNCIVDGHFQSYKYFEEHLYDIKKLFAPTQEVVDRLTAKYNPSKSVSLHVRRGDYVRLSEYHHNLDISYYINALDYFKDYKVLVFSDDIEWCKLNFKGDKFTFVDNNSELDDFYLMSLCEHNIISNSTFSWWAALLNSNPSKQVVCPDKWFGVKNQNLSTLDLIPQDWICLSEDLPKVEINLFDEAFAHLHKANGRYSSVHNKIPKHVKYCNGKMNYDGVTLFTERFLNSDIVDSVKSTQKVGWLLESREVESTYYDKFEQYKDKFDYVLTHDEQLLTKYPDKTKQIVFGGTWIKTQNHGLHPKTKNISMIYSNKVKFEGHRLRHTIANMVSGVDLYGTGTSRPVSNKEEALCDYRFSIIIENVRAKYYFTEKLIDCFMVGTIPIYWGCSNLQDYFDMSGVIVINNEYDLVKLLPTLNESFYNDKLSVVKANYEAAKHYATTEDWFYENIFTTKKD